MRIRMNISADDIASVPAWDCPRCYSLREIRSGDEKDLAKLLASAGVGQSAWDDFDTRRMIEYLDASGKWQGTRAIEHQGKLCAVAFATLRLDLRPPWGQLDYVCVHPKHRSQGLSFGVCAAVLQYFRAQGYENASLSTLPILPDDHRLAAIKTYLRLGFLPVMTKETIEICGEIYNDLDWPLPVKWWKEE
jgi:mycothiol synthase